MKNLKNLKLRQKHKFKYWFKNDSVISGYIYKINNF